MTNKPVITIKGLKTAKFASEETLCFQASVLELCEEYAKTLPDYVTKWGSGSMDLDILLNDMIEEQLANKQLRGWCKKSTLFRLPNDKKGSYRSFKEKFNPEIKKYIMKKYPNATIMNEVV